MVSVDPNDPFCDHVAIIHRVMKLPEYRPFFFWNIWFIGHQNTQAFANFARFVNSRSAGAHADGKLVALLVREKRGSSVDSWTFTFPSRLNPLSFYERLWGIVRRGPSICMRRTIPIVLIDVGLIRKFPSALL